MNRFTLAVGLTLAGFLVAAPIIAQQAPPSGDAAMGKRIYMADGCYECHGTAGAGGGYAGPRLAPNPLPFAAIKAQLRRPASRMPAYSERVLLDAQIADIVAYLQQWWRERLAAEAPPS